MAYPPVVVVDKNDRIIGAKMLTEVWAKGLYHRVVRIMAVDDQGRILLQRRAKTMTLYPDLWDTSSAGLVDEGMTYKEAALREVNEELGIVEPKLEEIGYYYAEATTGGRIIHNFNTVYRLLLNDPVIMYEPGEVSEIRWVTTAELEVLLRAQRDECTPGLHDVSKQFFLNKRSRYVGAHRDR